LPLYVGNTGDKRNPLNYLNDFNCFGLYKIQTLFARFIIMSTASVAPCLYRVVKVQLLATVFFQGVWSLVLSIDYFLTEKYYLIPVLAILLPIVFTPLKKWHDTICR